MARSTNGTSDKLESAAITALDGATLVTMSAWIYRASASDSAFAGFSVSGTNRCGFSPETGTTYIPVSNGGTSYAAVSGDWTGWRHYLLIFDGSGATDADKIKLWIDNSSIGLSYFSGPQPTSLGTNLYLSVGKDELGGARYFKGSYAELGVWLGVALGAGEIAALSNGVSPRNIRPGSLLNYWPIVGRLSPEADLVGGYGLTVTGSTTVVHPRIIRRRPQVSRWTPLPPPPAPGTLFVLTTGMRW